MWRWRPLWFLSFQEVSQGGLGRSVTLARKIKRGRIDLPWYFFCLLRGHPCLWSQKSVSRLATCSKLHGNSLGRFPITTHWNGLGPFPPTQSSKHLGFGPESSSPPHTFDLMFHDYFLLYFIFNVLRLLFVSFYSTFQDFSSLTHTKNSLHPFTIFTSISLYTHVYSSSCHPISNTFRPKTMSFTFHLLTTPT